MARKPKATKTITPDIDPDRATGLDILDGMEAHEEYEVPEIDLDFSLSGDLKEMAQKMGRIEAENLVKVFYRLQDQRIRAGGQTFALTKMDQPNRVVGWVEHHMHELERRVGKLIDYYSQEKEVAQWARAQKGIGPIFASALMAMVDPVRTQTAGDLWAYAGLVPGQRRKRGEKLNWNPHLKVLAWKIGKSFVKVSGREDAFYGKVFKDRKAYEMAKNEKGEYAEAAARYLAGRDYGKDTGARKTLESGKLPPFLIQARSERYAAKLFLAHFLEVYRNIEGLPVVAPWAIAHGGHTHYIAPPGWEMRPTKQAA